MDRIQFLEYVQACLGVRTLSQAPAEIKSTSKVLAEGSENRVPPLIKGFEFGDFFQGAPYKVIFFRVNDVRPLLSQDPSSMELFEKLRRALGFSSRQAPWVEAGQDHWVESLESLDRMSEQTVVLMGETLSFNTVSNSKGALLVIPDPAVLVAQEDLKRPTWDLLKKWKSQGLTNK